ncbi:MAG: hypothetical protein AAF363_18655 [Bacteroidota bacterium]
MELTLIGIYLGLGLVSYAIIKNFFSDKALHRVVSVEKGSKKDGYKHLMVIEGIVFMLFWPLFTIDLLRSRKKD